MAGKSRLSGWLRRGTDGTSGSARPARGARAPRSSRPTGPATEPDPRRDDLTRAAALAGFPVAPAAHPEGFGCSCDRIGCPIPGLHPVSLAWQTQASTDPQRVDQWLRTQPLANFVTATGRDHDVLDVPAEAGRLALERLTVDTATRRARSPRGARTGCCSSPRRAARPSTRTSGGRASWTATPRPPTSTPVSGGTAAAATCCCRRPGCPPGTAWSGSPDLGPDLPLPDPLPVLDILTDACAQFGYEPEVEPVAWGR